MLNKKLVLNFRDVSKKDIVLVGGKNASLGEMFRFLSRKGVKVPDGFIVTAYAYRYFTKYNNLDDKIRSIIESVDTHNINDLSQKGARLRQLILKSSFPPDLEKAIREKYKMLEKKYGRRISIAARSSATAEDLPTASFAGQHDTFLNLKGEGKVLEGIKRSFASLFTNRAISYREDKGFDHMKVYLSVGVQIMVRSNKASSGVIFTIDTETGFPNIIMINGSWGLGEYIVKGIVNPDQFIVFKKTLEKGFYPIIDRKLGMKNKKLIYSENIKNPTKNKITTAKERSNFCLSDKEIIKLSKWTLIIEKHYKNPQDIEWAKDGVTGEIFIIQSRPETVRSQEESSILEEYKLLEKGKIVVSGFAIGSKIGQGQANIIKSTKDIGKFKPRQVLVTTITDPDWEPIMKIASAIVTERGGRTSHAAIVSRELGIPAIVGTNNATKAIKTGEGVTVVCSEGEIGKVYKGLLKFKIEKTDIKKIKKFKTKIMMNLGDPDQAFSLSKIPNDGVGLAREEFLVTSSIMIHPLALLNYKKIKDKKIKKEIDKLTRGYKNKKEYYIEKLSFGIAKIVAAFYPKDVIFRTSDFKTNEYRGLIGGELYEGKEENPMLGFRGASRYYDKDFKRAFDLECEAFKKVREKMGFSNIKIMLPFVRTPEEGKKVLEIMKKNGLPVRVNPRVHQHKSALEVLEVYVMCELPSNIFLAEEFAKIFDGFSIGSNDLTQLILGLDRDNNKVSSVGDERNEAVKKAIHDVIKVAKKYRKKIGICGQAPSDFPEFAEFLVDEGIDSISLNPDSIIKTILYLSKK